MLSSFHSSYAPPFLFLFFLHHNFRGQNRDYLVSPCLCLHCFLIHPILAPLPTPLGCLHLILEQRVVSPSPAHWNSVLSLRQFVPVAYFFHRWWHRHHEEAGQLWQCDNIFFCFLSPFPFMWNARITALRFFVTRAHPSFINTSTLDFQSFIMKKSTVPWRVLWGCGGWGRNMNVVFWCFLVFF